MTLLKVDKDLKVVDMDSESSEAYVVGCLVEDDQVFKFVPNTSSEASQMALNLLTEQEQVQIDMILNAWNYFEGRI